MTDTPLPQSQSSWAHLVYVLRANPVTRAPNRLGKPVARALLGRNELLRWLSAQGERYGFAPQPESLRLIQGTRRCTPSRGRTYTINDVVFSGELRVLQSHRLLQALENGIGRSKAFGYGMLLLSNRQ